MLISSGVSHPVSAVQFSIQEPYVPFPSADHAYVLKTVETYDALEPLSAEVGCDLGMAWESFKDPDFIAQQVGKTNRCQKQRNKHSFGGGGRGRRFLSF